jgi:hypothetical protein
MITKGNPDFLIGKTESRRTFWLTWYVAIHGKLLNLSTENACYFVVNLSALQLNTLWNETESKFI